MERGRRGKAFYMCVLLSGLVSQSLVTSVVCRSLEGFTDQKNYSPNPQVGSTPKHSDIKPACDCPTPSGGGSGHTPTPSHGRRGSHRSPTRSHGSGGSSGIPTPSQGIPTPSHGSGGYYNSPPSSSGNSPPAIIISTPPPSPVFEPVIPTPTTPVNPTPPSPFIPDPNTPPISPGTCSYWSTHPEAIWAIFGYWDTISQTFGAASSSAFGKNLSLLEALTNTRTDGIGALYREGTAALLNSIVNQKFAFTTQQVKDAFAAAIVSEKAAASQAELFKQANEGRLKH